MKQQENDTHCSRGETRVCLHRNIDEMKKKKSSTITNQNTRPWHVLVWSSNLYYSQYMNSPKYNLCKLIELPFLQKHVLARAHRTFEGKQNKTHTHKKNTPHKQT